MSVTDPVYLAGRSVYPSGEQAVANKIWDPDNLQWVPETTASMSNEVATAVAVTNYPAVQVVSLSPGSSLTPSAPTAATVGVSSAQVLAANAARTGLVIINLSGNNVSFGLGAAAVLNNGITLTPFGSWVMDENTLTNGAINAIASAASSAISIQEFS